MRSLKLLIVDECPFQLMAVHQMLNACGIYQVRTAENLEAAEQVLARSGPVDLVICAVSDTSLASQALPAALAASRSVTAQILLGNASSECLNEVARETRRHGLEVMVASPWPLSPGTLHRLIDNWLQRNQPAVLAAASLNDSSLGDELQRHRLPLLLHQWSAYFQPQVGPQGQVLGVKALARWEHPEHGLLAPASFLSLVEQAGLLAELTWHMIEASLALCVSVRQVRGDVLPIALNVPLAVLEVAGFKQRLGRRLSQLGIPPRTLTLDLLDRHERLDSSGHVDAVGQLHLLGCRLSIDDFGMGSSDLQRLLHLPAVELRIPGEFVQGVANDSRKAAIVGGALAMAQRMGLGVVACGVESADDYQYLLALGVNAVQGYFIARPMPAPTLIAWLQDDARPHDISSYSSARVRTKPSAAKVTENF